MRPRDPTGDKLDDRGLILIAILCPPALIAIAIALYVQDWQRQRAAKRAR